MKQLWLEHFCNGKYVFKLLFQYKKISWIYKTLHFRNDNQKLVSCQNAIFIYEENQKKS